MSEIQVTETMAERWRLVPGFPKYRVSDRGRIQSQRHRNGMPSEKWRLLAPSKNKRGYPQVCLKGDGGRVRWVELHRLVWEAFNGTIPPGAIVRHAIDPNPSNNRLDNLAIGTQSENCRDKEKHGTAQKGEKHPRVKLTAEQVLAIRKDTQQTLAALAAAYNVSESTISVVRARKSWAHLGTESGTD